MAVAPGAAQGAAAAVVADEVWPCDNFVSSVFEICDVLLNDKLITQHEHYTYRAFMYMLVQSNIAMANTTWPLGYSNDLPDQKLNTTDSSGIITRYNLIKGSKDFDLAAQLFADLAQQGELLLPGVDVRLSLRQNPNKFLLIITALEAREYNVEFTKVGVQARLV